MTSHPLDPLSADEIRQVTALLARERGVGPGWRYASMELLEPDKDELAAHRDGDAFTRRAAAVVRDSGRATTYRATVSLGHDLVIGWDQLPGDVQPNITVDEWSECDAFLRRTPELIDALARRGITDLDLVLVDTWAYGAALVPGPYRGRRIGWSDVWVRDSPTGNPYANPVGGLHPVVDLDRMELLELEDDGRGVEGPSPVRGEYLPSLTGLPARELAPLEVRQPEGVSFELDGNLLTWQNWSMRIGFTYREGLVLHTVGYRDGDRLRPIAHRMSFAEMVVPYRDPNPDHYRRTAFDIGEWGLGFMTTSLMLGCDCLGEIRYLDAVLHDSHGEPVEIPQAICIHEEDDGVLWKHVDPPSGAAVRRSRRLVVSFHVTVANYEYLVYWRFYQDGSIECEVRATGIMVTTRYPAAQEPPPFGTVVDRETYAPFHQHFIVARLDLDIDGRSNTVVTTHTEPLPVSDSNPHGLALVSVSTPLLTETEGRQDVDWASHRAWKVVSSHETNGLGSLTGYQLVPSASIPPQFDASSPVLERAGAIAHQVWVTPYDPAERWPCGEFPTQGSGSAEGNAGLPQWTAADRPIANTDVVLWHVFGIHHVTRPEDWPVMPADRVAFWLKPFGFFDRNPALDLPDPHAH